MNALDENTLLKRDESLANSLIQVAVIGLGYVGLPLAQAFSNYFTTVGFDINTKKICTLQNEKAAPNQFKKLLLTANPEQLRTADFIIICVPTPVDDAMQPDLSPLESASEIAGKYMKLGATVVYESTVYPGATEEVCIPILEKNSGLIWQQDFHVGYSPERINVGDDEHTLSKIVKLVSGDTPTTTEKIASLYKNIIKAGIHKTYSIKVAEAAKVIENIQRDLNIALINEFAIIFHRLGIDTHDVLEAAGTKWNFLPFKPGLVGGHCIGVDPYYLTYKAQLVGYHPEVILAGRRINDNMAKFIAEHTVKHMLSQGTELCGAKANILGISFKENCSDIRNSKVIDLINELKKYHLEICVHDPLADQEDTLHEYGIKLMSWDQLPKAEVVIVAVAHEEFLQKSLDHYFQIMKKNGCFIDVKAKFNTDNFTQAGISVWRL